MPGYVEFSDACGFCNCYLSVSILVHSGICQRFLEIRIKKSDCLTLVSFLRYREFSFSLTAPECKCRTSAFGVPIVADVEPDRARVSSFFFGRSDPPSVPVVHELPCVSAFDHDIHPAAFRTEVSLALRKINRVSRLGRLLYSKYGIGIPAIECHCRFPRV